MTGTIVNAGLVIIGSLVGVCFRNCMSQRFMTILLQGLGLCVLAIGVSSAIVAEDMLCVIISMVLGCIIGESLRIEDRLEGLGDKVRKVLIKGEQGNSRFTEGFVTTTLLYCIGSMAIMGAMEAGIMGQHSIYLTKGVLDGITSVTFAAAMGMGVACSAVSVILYQGGLVLLFRLIGPVMSDQLIMAMNAVGGTVICAIAFNMLDVGKEKIKVGNMLPAIFMPCIYIPISHLISGIG